MDTYTLARDGQRPLRFQGTIVAENTGARTHGRDNTRWHNIVLYRLEDGRSLLHVEYETRWQGELGHAAVVPVPDVDTAIDALEGFDACAWVEGYRALIARNPQSASADHYLSRQVALEEDITRRFHAQVAELAASLGMVEDLEPTIALPGCWTHPGRT